MATVTKSDKALIAALGPMKMEVIQVTSASNGETVESKLQNPTFAFMLPNGDASGTFDGSAAVSGKTITLHDPPASGNIVVIVFGDALA